MNPAFSLYFAGDAYSTANKIMGRQSAGKSFMAGLARTWPGAQLSGLGNDHKSAQAMQAQLKGDGFSGQLRWSSLPDLTVARETGCLYYPAPPTTDLAATRNRIDARAFSLMGVTHTLSSASAMDQIAHLVLPPFTAWDALICTSTAAHRLVSTLQDEMRAYWREAVGATRFVDLALPIIPLGVNAPDFARTAPQRASGRAALGLKPEEVAFLFAGRLSFHAKANPAPVYQALEAAAQQHPVVCVEAGVFPNEHIQNSYRSAQQALAPSVRFIWVDGKDAAAYRSAWQAADVFVSLSDNIQETFGLTPVEAMAAGLPVIVSDWDGYKDTVRDGVDGFRIPTVVPGPGGGPELALRHALGLDSYDFYIGRASLATVVLPPALRQAVLRLASDAALREQMGQQGQARAQAVFDWPVVLRRYDELAQHLGQLRAAAAQANAAGTPQAWPQRADPFERFAHFATTPLDGRWLVQARPALKPRFNTLMGLAVANFAFEPTLLPAELLHAMVERLDAAPQALPVHELLQLSTLGTAAAARALMWLWKFDLVDVGQP